MLSHCNCSSKTEESNKTCLQIVNPLRRLLQTGPNLTLKATVAPFGAGTAALTPLVHVLWVGTVLSHPAEMTAQRACKKGRHKSATFPHQPEQLRFLGGTGDRGERLGWLGEGADSLRLPCLGRVGPGAAQEGQACFLVKVWLPLPRSRIIFVSKRAWDWPRLFPFNPVLVVG